MSLQVLEAFGHITLQGAPEPGRRQFGVPPGGAFDQESLALANALIGNDLSSPAIEIAMGALKLEAKHATRLSVVGAHCPIFIDGRGVRCQSSFHLLPGQVLDIQLPTKGARVYVGIPVKDGCVQSGQIRPGNILDADCSSGPPIRRGRIVDGPPQSLDSRPLRVIPLANAKLPAEAAKVSLNSNRVGIRLHGATLDPEPEQLSEPACPGAIQVTNEGGLIILGPDGPTIGGYKKIGVVCAADLDLLGQLRPSQEITFQPIDLAEAHIAWIEGNKELEAKLDKLRLP